MPNSSLCVTVENAISHVVHDFQKYPERFWNERDIHWSLFHYIKQEQTVKEAYPTQLVRAEFPTLKVFPGNKPARGHYDLVILDAKSYSRPEIQNMELQSSWRWDEYLKLIQINVAIEVKLWLARRHIEDRAGWDIQKLTDIPNNVQSAYFLNFVQLNFKFQYMRQYYQELRAYLITKKQPGLNILCVTSNSQIQSKSDNWL